MAVIANAMTAMAAAVGGQEQAPHIRIVNPPLRAHFDDALVRSKTMRDLVARVEAAPVLVFIDCEPHLPGSLSGRVGLVARVRELRYVRVDIRCSLALSQLAPVLAHELQHALEIGEDPSIVDTDSMESYFESVGFEIGRDGGHRAFETVAARDIQRRVQLELSRSQKPNPAGQRPPDPTRPDRQPDR